MENKNQTILKPWGQEIILEKKRGYWIKKLMVRQGASLSLQSHQDRSEIWLVLAGRVAVTKGQTRRTLDEGEFIKIAKKEKHRLTGLKDSWILELAFGRVRQNDIIRFQDDYGRVK